MFLWLLLRCRDNVIHTSPGPLSPPTHTPPQPHRFRTECLRVGVPQAPYFSPTFLLFLFPHQSTSCWAVGCSADLLKWRNPEGDLPFVIVEESIFFPKNFIGRREEEGGG